MICKECQNKQAELELAYMSIDTMRAKIDFLEKETERLNKRLHQIIMTDINSLNRGSLNEIHVCGF